jgi:thiamine pyrophosphate-dependent acetolactate synthase large subunit-like protein
MTTAQLVVDTLIKAGITQIHGMVGDSANAIAHGVKVIISLCETLKVLGFPPFATDLDNPDFALMASAIGVKGILVERPDQLAPAITGREPGGSRSECR